MSKPALDITREITQERGFTLYTLRSRELELTVAPDLGAKLVSLKNLCSGREWLWHPDGGPNLFPNRCGDDFSSSTLVGADECLPTIAPCAWQQRKLPDHGEVWSAPWRVDAKSWKRGVLRTSLTLPVSPLVFERAIAVKRNTVSLRYQLTNRSPAPEKYLWALHPLLRLQPGDQLALPDSTRSLLNGEAWLDAVSETVPAGGCSKLFAAPLQEGWAALHNPLTGDRIVFEWAPAENRTLGLWLTRGGWHGHHHFAIEPTNGAPDSLLAAAAQGRCGTIPPRASVTWSVIISVAG